MQSIPRRRFIQTIAAGAAGAALSRFAGAAAAGEKPATRSPNLLFVFPDQFRKEALGFMNADPVRTPHLDRFASESLVLTHAVSNHPVCSPYRAMLLTGQYPYKNGVHMNCTSARTKSGNFLKESARTFSDVLAEAGYHCGYIGKWHLEGPKPPFVEPPRGDGAVWDAYTPVASRHGFAFWHSYGCCDDHLHPHYWVGDAPVDKRTVVDQWSPEHEANVAIDFIANRPADKPWALFVSMNPPHPPYQEVPEKYRQLYTGAKPEELLKRPNVPFDATDPTAVQNVKKAKGNAASYFAAVTGVDEQFGRILQCLRDRQIERDTIVVFTSDHGEMMGSHGRMGKNVCFTEAFGIPFIIRWPGHIAPGRDDLLLGAPDAMPTLLALMGLGAQTPAEVEGADHSPALLGRPHKRPESAFYIVSSATNPTVGERGIRTHRHTFVVSIGKDGRTAVRLYDDINDPYQMKNIATDHPESIAELAPQLNRWMQRTGDPWPAFTPGA